MRLQSHLLLLTLGTLLPMLAFGVAAALLIADREEAVFRRGATERTLAVLTAIDAELAGYATNLRILANSSSLETDDLPSFRDEVTRILRIQPSWRSVALAWPDGQQLLRVPESSSARSSLADRSSFNAVLETGGPVFGTLIREEGAYRFSVRVPVFRDGETKFVLSARIQPSSIAELLRRQRLPSDWIGVVLDADDRILARTVDQDSMLGQSASASLRSALDTANEGWFRGETLEGIDVYAPFNRSSFSGWTVAMGIPAADVEGTIFRTTWLLYSGISAAIGVAFLLAGGLARRISVPISSLASVAKAIGSGSPMNTSPAESRVDEVTEVTHALVNAGEAVRAREQALRDADRAKNEFLAMLAHELRNPLSALSSSVQVLEVTGPRDESSRTATEILSRQVQHMSRLVDDLLEAGRATSGKITLTRRALDLGDVVSRFMAALKASGSLDRHEIAVDTSPVWARVDEARIEQMLSNLLANAAKFTPAGGRINVHASRRGDYAVIEVVDTGIGLTPELASRAFDLFVQGEQSLDRSMGGLGIGLTLVKRLAELQGGDVSAASDGPGLGARFTVRLPAIEMPTQASPDRPPQAGAGRSRKVLLIEDNDDARRTLSTALTLYGYEVSEAADGPEALSAAAETEYEVALIDIGLPGIDGYEVADRLRATTAGQAMLLIALTGYGDSESRRRALEAGFDAYFTKPVLPASLAQFIETASTDSDAAAPPAARS